MNHKPFAISFKGGFARGLGSIGFIRFFQEENILPTIYAGSSMGAILATGFALEVDWKDMLNSAEKIKIRSLVSPKAFMFERKVISFEKFTNILSSVARINNSDVKIEDVSHKLVIFATDLQKRARVLLEQGRLFEALAASSQIPFTIQNGNADFANLTDGDFSNSYSAAALRLLGAEIVIGASYASNMQLQNNPTGIYNLLMHQIGWFNDIYDPVDLELNFLVEKHGMVNFKVGYLVDEAYEIIKGRKKEILKLLS